MGIFAIVVLLIAITAEVRPIIEKIRNDPTFGYEFKIKQNTLENIIFENAMELSR